MKRHKGLLDRVVCFENLHAAARKALCGRRMRSPGFEFLLELERELIELREELLSGSYLPGEYHYFQIYEPKCRTVAAAPFRDRVVHHAIVRVIQPLFEARFISGSFACRPRKGTHRAMKRALFFSRKSPFALKCDIQKYFPSIDHGVLMAKRSRVIGDERLLKVIANILTWLRTWCLASIWASRIAALCFSMRDFHSASTTFKVAPKSQEFLLLELDCYQWDRA